ncbi:MAG: epoxyqueuosine reductase QueH [Candidatus Omnitrophica bacterium]|nr:epoxyqueuosine reductase QueH [Candidatus Omnitrophota bacterium]MCM8793830.1 epoxyqueuosine reductase QueH [Candidatus Omnitrophota bacterium]
MAKLLLHICCAPCTIYPLSFLKEKGFEVTGFFYNPNIHPEEEFVRRRDALYEFFRREVGEVIYFDYLPEDFFIRIEPELSPAERCPQCWRLRLEKTALYAQEHNFDYFSTTLLVSPYQDQAKLRTLGEELSQKYKVKFFFEDFRTGFREAHRKANEWGLYLQKYCGCVYSKLEREEAISQKKR